MATSAPLWMSLPRRFLIHWGSLPGRPSDLYTAAGSLLFGTRAAALTHFSAIFWRPASSVVVIRRPPAAIVSQVGTFRPQTLSVSSFWTAHTKCGATQFGVV